MTVIVLDAELRGFEGISRRLAIKADQKLTDLHRLLQDAFGWADDHLYSFWIGERSFDPDADEYTAPYDLEPGMRSAGVSLAELALEPGQPLTYVFDFGDHWEVGLRLVALEEQGDGRYPRILESAGEPPPQYEDGED